MKYLRLHSIRVIAKQCCLILVAFVCLEAQASERPVSKTINKSMKIINKAIQVAEGSPSPDTIRNSAQLINSYNPSDRAEREFRLLASAKVLSITENRLMALRKRAIPEPSLNVAPPLETGMPSGVAPSEIRDPKLRGIYVAAIEENAKNAHHWREVQLLEGQAKLRTLSLTSDAEELYPKVEDRILALRKILATAGVSEATIRTLASETAKANRK